jgi:hypothetical protein
MAKRVVQTSGVVAGAKKAPRVVPPDPVTLLERFKDFPAIDVISRRFNDPNDPGSLPILLKDEDRHCCANSDHQLKLKSGATICPACKRPARKWYVRWFNLAQEGRNAQMRGKGYVAVEVKELQDSDDVSDLFTGKDTAVRRGDRGQEILGKQPLELYLEIKRRQRLKRNEQAVNANRTRTQLAEAAGRALGDEAGQSIHDGAIQVESMTRHKTTLGAEADLQDDLAALEE